MAGIDAIGGHCSRAVLKRHTRIHDNGGRNVVYKKGQSPGDCIHPPFPNTPKLTDTHET